MQAMQSASQHQVRLLQAAQHESKRNKAKIEGRDRDAAEAELARDDTLRGTGFSAKDVANAAELTGTGMRLDLVAAFNDGSRWVYEIKSLAFCPSNYGTRWKNKAKAWGAGASPADAKAATTATDRDEKASGIDERLGFRGKDGVAHALKGIGKVVGLTVGGCAELSSTVHRLVFHLATQAGKWEAKDSGEEVEECILVQKQRIGRRIARQVWRDIHQHSKARRRFVGPSPPDPTHNGPSRRTQLRGLDEDEAIYQREKRRQEEEEQQEAMLTRRANERTVYARDGLHATGRGCYTQSRGMSAGGRSRSGHI